MSVITMNQVIHAAVRRDFDRLAQALDSFKDGDRKRAEDLERAYANLRTELTQHHTLEDNWIWPMLAKVGVEASLLATMESEHHDMAAALARTGVVMDSFAASGAAADAAAARESVTRTRLVVDQHLTHEEKDLEPVMIPHFGSPEWKEVEKKITRQPPRVAGRFFAWVTDGMSDEHRAYFKSEVPAPVVLILGGLFGRTYKREVASVWQGATS
jgi:hemerythrin-like domain-containing protein